MSYHTSVIYYVATSLDGYIADKDGGVEWLNRYDSGEPTNPPEDYGYQQFFDSVDAMVMGRLTYEQVLAFNVWHYGDKPCWIFSSQPELELKHGVIHTAQSPTEFVDSVSEKIKSIWLVGGTALANSFRTAGLITHYHITLIPCLLGDGISLFETGFEFQRLNLDSQRTFANGFVQLRYSVEPK